MPKARKFSATDLGQRFRLTQKSKLREFIVSKVLDTTSILLPAYLEINQPKFFQIIPGPAVDRILGGPAAKLAVARPHPNAFIDLC